MKAHFRKEGWIFLPVSIAGWIITLLFLAVSIYILIAIDSNYNSLYHSLIRFFPYFVSFAVIWYWIASHTCGK